MIQYPLKFEVQGKTAAGIAPLWSSGPVTSATATATDSTRSESVSPSLTLAIPPEFDGPGGGYSPEDLYALALLNCFAATFKVIAEKSSLAYETLALAGTLTVDRDERGRPWMKRFDFRIELRGVADAERGRRLLEKTSQSCLILASVKTELSFEFAVPAVG